MKFLSQINVNTEYTLPIVDGTNGQVLTSDGNGNVYWGTISAGSLTLGGLSDVTITTPSSGQLLRYGIPPGSGESNPFWHNFTPNYLTPSSSIDNLGDVTITSAATGQLLRWNGSAWVNWTHNFLTSFTETDPTVPSHVKSISTTNITNWNAGYNDSIRDVGFSTANGVLTLTQQDGGTLTVDLDGRYLESYNETDPVYTASSWYGTTNNSRDWDDAYAWGNHADFEYLTSFNETDPTVPAHVKSITTTEKSNWNTAYEWGSHASAGYATTSYVTTAIANLVDSAPSTLDTLNELAAALGDDPNFATTVTNSLATKVPQTRTITINGTAFDLSANRSWTISTDDSTKVPIVGDVEISGMKSFTTDVSSQEDWQNSPISILERDGIGSTSASDIYSPNINFHWRNRVSRSIWMDASGGFHFGEYSATGVPSNDSVLYAGGGDSSRWNDAYSWGNHAGLYAAASHTHTIANVTGLQAALDSKLSSEADTLATVTGRGASTSTSVTFSGGFNATGTQDKISSITFHRLHPNSGSPLNIDLLDSFILSKTDGGYGGGTKPSGSHNGFGVISLQTHSGNYFTQLGLDTNQNDLWIRSANDTTSFGSWVRFATRDWVQAQGYLTSDSDSQQLSWDAGAKNLSISNGNTITLDGLATEEYVTSQGYITGYTETDTLATVTGRGASTSASVNFGANGGAVNLTGLGSHISFKDQDNIWTGYVGFDGNTGRLEFPGRNVRIVSGYNGTIELNTGVSGYNSGRIHIPQGYLSVDNNYVAATAFHGQSIKVGTAGSTPTVDYGIFHQSGVGLGIASGAGGSTQGISFWSHNGSSYFESVRIAGSTGNVGIGTTAPLYKLQASSAASFGTTAYGVLNIAGDNPAYIKIRTAIPFSYGAQGYTVNVKGFQYGSAETLDLQICWHQYADIFYNPTVTSKGSFAPVVRLARESGLVVIVLTWGQYWPKLYVESVHNYANDGYANGWSWVDENVTGDKTVTLSYKNNFGDGFVKTAAGNVGIGTTSPSTKLDVNGVITATGGTSTNWNTAYGWGNHSGLYLQLSGGTLSGDLNTSGAIAFRDGAGTYSNIIRAAGYPSEGYTSSDKYWMEYRAKGGHHFVLNTDGGVGSGENSMDDFTIWQGAIDGDRLLELTNGGSLTISGTFTEQSSIRYKENVKSIPSVSKKVEHLEAVSYNKIGSNQEEIGLIAEDVAQLFPEVVKYDKEGRPDGVNYSRLSVILLKAVQELTERVNKLENK